ncbi:hypothetical protein P3W45_000965 [Vairimorpha bombi]
MKLCDLNLEYKSRTILDSRGNPTSEVDIIFADRTFRSSCPSGASVGLNECIVLVDGRTKYNGKNIEDVHHIIKDVICPLLKDSDADPLDSTNMDKILLSIDASDNKQNVGVNSILPFSLSFCKLSAYLNNELLFSYISKLYGATPKMPLPHFNVLNGGKHSGNEFSIQEIMIVFESMNIQENIESASVFYQELKKTITKHYGGSFSSVGDEGGFAPPIQSMDEAILLLKETGDNCNKKDFKIAIDVAANSFYENGSYIMNGIKMSTNELCEYYIQLINKYPLIYSIEDPFSEEDIKGWEMLSKKAPRSLNIVGDDLTVTNSNTVKYAGENNLCNVLLVKPNQIGSVTETLEAVRIAREHGMKIMVSHRSGETEDTFISHLAVGIGSEYIKAGAPCRGERVAKYNELLRIYEGLNK